MPHPDTIPYFTYSYLKGPLSEVQLTQTIREGNCRLLLQLFFYIDQGIYLPESELLNPQAYLHTGTTIKEASTPHRSVEFFNGLPRGAVLYAEKITDKFGRPADFSPAAFDAQDDYLVRLHSAIYAPDFRGVAELLAPAIPLMGVSSGKPAIIHATAVQGSTTAWSVDKFLQHYKPVRAKVF